MGPAPAQIVGKRLLDLVEARFQIPHQEGHGIDHHAIGAITALCSLIGDKSGLHRMGIVDCTKTFKGRDRFTDGLADADLAGSDRLAIDKHAASPALTEPAAEFCAGER